MSGPEYTITELARRFGLATHVLRHWEDVGLLAPARRPGGQRRYDRQDVLRVAVILFWRDASLPLAKARTGMLSSDVEHRHDELRGCLQLLDRRIARAQAARAVIEYALRCDTPEVLECPKFQEAVRSHDPRVDFR